MSAQEWHPCPGHIVHVYVQYSDSEGGKCRFPVVVSSAQFNRQNPEVIVAFATSSANIRHPRSYDVEISDRHPDFSKTGLTHGTTIRCGRLWTVNKTKILDVVGTVPGDLLRDVQKLVVKSFE